MHRTTHSSMNDLLRILRKYFETNFQLPKDTRTFLQTPNEYHIFAMGNGEFWYNGLKKNLQNLFMDIKESMSISLTFNIDGLPPFNSAPLEFWPILFRVKEFPSFEPSIVAIVARRSPHWKNSLKILLKN